MRYGLHFLLSCLMGTGLTVAARAHATSESHLCARALAGMASEDAAVVTQFGKLYLQALAEGRADIASFLLTNSPTFDAGAHPSFVAESIRASANLEDVRKMLEASKTAWLPATDGRRALQTARAANRDDVQALLAEYGVSFKNMDFGIARPLAVLRDLQKIGFNREWRRWLLENVGRDSMRTPQPPRYDAFPWTGLSKLTLPTPEALFRFALRTNGTELVKYLVSAKGLDLRNSTDANSYHRGLAEDLYYLVAYDNVELVEFLAREAGLVPFWIKHWSTRGSPDPLDNIFSNKSFVVRGMGYVAQDGFPARKTLKLYTTLLDYGYGEALLADERGFELINMSTSYVQEHPEDFDFVKVLFEHEYPFKEQVIARFKDLLSKSRYSFRHLNESTVPYFRYLHAHGVDVSQAIFNVIYSHNIRTTSDWGPDGRAQANWMRYLVRELGGDVNVVDPNTQETPLTDHYCTTACKEVLRELGAK